MSARNLQQLTAKRSASPSSWWDNAKQFGSNFAAEFNPLNQNRVASEFLGEPSKVQHGFADDATNALGTAGGLAGAGWLSLPGAILGYGTGQAIRPWTSRLPNALDAALYHSVPGVQNYPEEAKNRVSSLFSDAYLGARGGLADISASVRDDLKKRHRHSKGSYLTNLPYEVYSVFDDYANSEIRKDQRADGQIVKSPEQVRYSNSQQPEAQSTATPTTPLSPEEMVKRAQEAYRRSRPSYSGRRYYPNYRGYGRYGPYHGYPTSQGLGDQSYESSRSPQEVLEQVFRRVRPRQRSYFDSRFNLYPGYYGNSRRPYLDSGFYRYPGYYGDSRRPYFDPGLNNYPPHRLWQ